MRMQMMNNILNWNKCKIFERKGTKLTLCNITLWAHGLGACWPTGIGDNHEHQGSTFSSKSSCCGRISSLIMCKPIRLMTKEQSPLPNTYMTITLGIMDFHINWCQIKGRSSATKYWKKCVTTWTPTKSKQCHTTHNQMASSNMYTTHSAGW